MTRPAQVGKKKLPAPATRTRPLAESVLQLIWSERRISRAEIARRATLSRSTVSDVVAELLETGLVLEGGTGPSLGGRRPIVLEFQDDAYCILGIEVGAAHVAVALTDLRGRVLAWEDRGHPVRDDPQGTRSLTAELCVACLSASRGSRERLVGIGVALPTPVDIRDPDHVSEIVMPAWGGRLGLDFLGPRFGAPMFIDNDANLGALAEGWWGAGRGVENFAYVKVATGVGSGHVIGGEIYRGASGVAGEIGHLAMDPHGEPCVCGLRGCLATLVGAPALVARAGTLLAEHPDSVLAGTRITIGTIEDAALAGDPLALRLAREAAEYLGVAVASMLNLMNPARVIMGGGLARLGELLLEPMRETVERRTLVTSMTASALRMGELGPRSVAIGAATMVLKEALADTRLFPVSARRMRAK